LLSKDGTLGIAYKVIEDLECITSGAILHLTIDQTNILPDYLTLVLNSKLTQMQAERDSGGSIIKHWKPSEIKEILIPIIDQEIQSQISSLVQESFSLKKTSENLLAIAKKAVEMAIEENEETAMKFIEQEECLA
jgi:restriction endonuclease S subunit